MYIYMYIKAKWRGNIGVQSLRKNIYGYTYINIYLYVIERAFYFSQVYGEAVWDGCVGYSETAAINPKANTCFA